VIDGILRIDAHGLFGGADRIVVLVGFQVSLSQKQLDFSVRRFLGRGGFQQRNGLGVIALFVRGSRGVWRIGLRNALHLPNKQAQRRGENRFIARHSSRL
jgi:hypothetical protein